ncbi:MAG TPA: hypothetical protein VFC18_06735 [Burkholderiales bacterium]|nr:hypothetical protein [Burkholderiales bacterium]
MKTPLKPSLDDEIYEVEERIARRRSELPRVARATRQTALHALASPAGLATAAAIGFFAGGGLRRRPQRKAYVERRKSAQGSKGAMLGSLLMSGVATLLRSQFGSPAGMAQALLSKVRSSPHGDGRSVAR